MTSTGEGGGAYMREDEHRGGRMSTEEGGRAQRRKVENRGGRTSTAREDEHREGRRAHIGKTSI